VRGGGGGVGISVRRRSLDGIIVVDGIERGSAAAEAAMEGRIAIGDELHDVEGYPVRGMLADHAVSILNGDPDTPLKIGVVKRERRHGRESQTPPSPPKFPGHPDPHGVAVPSPTKGGIHVEADLFRSGNGNRVGPAAARVVDGVGGSPPPARRKLYSESAAGQGESGLGWSVHPAAKTPQWRANANASNAPEITPPRETGGRGRESPMPPPKPMWLTPGRETWEGARRGVEGHLNGGQEGAVQGGGGRARRSPWSFGGGMGGWSGRGEGMGFGGRFGGGGGGQWQPPLMMSGRGRDEVQGGAVANGGVDYGGREQAQNDADGILGRRLVVGRRGGAMGGQGEQAQNDAVGILGGGLGIGRGEAMGGQGDAIVFHGNEGNGHESRAVWDSSQNSRRVGGGDEISVGEQGRVDLRSFYFRRESFFP
jgi:hypothetical protein